MSAGGTVVTFALEGPTDTGKRDAFAVLDALRLIDISNNLGDAKSLVTHPATTTHRRLTPSEREAAGIGGGVIRLSVGLEDVADLQADLDQALRSRV
jgi:O-succinylhomoserine sulfhydrylase